MTPNVTAVDLLLWNPEETTVTADFIGGQIETVWALVAYPDAEPEETTVTADFLEAVLVEVDLPGLVEYQAEPEETTVTADFLSGSMTTQLIRYSHYTPEETAIVGDFLGGTLT